MPDFTIIPATDSGISAYPSVVGQPSADGPIVYPENQYGDRENLVPFARETGIDPNQIPTLKDMSKKPALRVVKGGVASADPGAGGPVANAESLTTGGAPAGSLVISNTAAANAAVNRKLDRPDKAARLNPDGTPAKTGMPWWQIALVAGGALLVGYSLAKKSSDEPLVADMDDEEGEEEEEG